MNHDTIPDHEDLILWPDNTCCFAHELRDMTFMSDDYERIPYGTARWDEIHQQHNL